MLTLDFALPDDFNDDEEYSLPVAFVVVTEM